MTSSIWISLIAVTVSTLSFLLHFKKYRSERPKLTAIANPEGTYFFPVTDADKNTDHYQSPFRIIVNLTLVNESDRPITIIEYKLYDGNFGSLNPLISTQFMNANDSYTVESTNHSSKVIKIHNNHLKPIFVIEPYGAAQGFVFFPNVPIIHGNDLLANLVVETSRGSFNELVTLRKSLQTD